MQIFPLILSFLILLAAFALFGGFGWLKRYLLGAIKEKLAESEGETIAKGLGLFLGLILTLARIFVGVVAAFYIANLFPASRTLSYQIRDILFSSFFSPILTLGKTAYSVTDLFILGSLLFVLVLVSNALNFELLVWTAEPDQQFLLKSDLYFRLYETLCQQKIEIPFPQRDLHLRSGQLGLSPQLESALIRLAQQFDQDQRQFDE